MRRAVAVFAAAATAIALAVLALRGRVLRVAVAGGSMTPGLQPDDFLVLRAGPPRSDCAFGQIVALRDPRPEGSGRIVLKRVVGLPGESLRVGGGVQINGRVLDEPYAHGETPAEQHRGINRLAEDEYFVLGDHRGGSTDSRDFGPIRRNAILGTAVFRYWPPERAGRLRAPERRLLAAVDTAAAEPPRPTARPLPWLQQRERPEEPTGRPPEPRVEDIPPPAEGNP